MPTRVMTIFTSNFRSGSGRRDMDMGVSMRASAFGLAAGHGGLVQIDELQFQSDRQGVFSSGTVAALPAGQHGDGISLVADPIKVSSQGLTEGEAMFGFGYFWIACGVVEDFGAVGLGVLFTRVEHLVALGTEELGAAAKMSRPKFGMPVMAPLK